MHRKLQEVDLYAPIEKYFAEQGFDVHGEVNDCDVVAIKKEQVVIIELKKSLQLEVIMQAVKRQRLTNEVYIAVIAPKISLKSRKKNDLRHLLRRLEVGLLTVDFTEEEPVVTQILSPKPFNKQRSIQQSKRSKDKLLAEIAGRHTNLNVGGSHQTEIMTAYREMCVFIACCLNKFGPMSAKQLKEIGTNEKTYSILYKNYYGWFTRVHQGIYNLTEQGKNEFKVYEHVVTYYQTQIELKSNTSDLLDL